MSNADDSDFSPSAAATSEASSESDQETLVEIADRKRAEGASKKRSAVATAAKPPKKTRKKKSNSVSARSRSVSFGSEELLLVARAFMKVSNDAKHSTDKKAEKFWDEVYLTFEKFVAISNKNNESNPDFTPIEPGRGAESIRNCWQRRIQPAVQKFAGIIYSNPPASGEVKDDALMDLYYSRMREEYASRSHTYVKDCPKTFNKLMKVYHFLSQHPKFEIEFPPDGSRPPPKHPNSIRKGTAHESTGDTEQNLDESKTFLKLPSRKERPAGREATKRVDAINLIVDKVSDKVQPIRDNTATLQDMWLKIEGAIEMTSRHMKTNVENQIMAHAPSPVRKAYFDNLYKSIAAEAETRVVESANRKKQVELEQRELELKEQSLKLRESLQRASVDEAKSSAKNPPEVESVTSPNSTNCDTNILPNKSKWMQLLGTGLVVESHHLCNAESGAEFACVHNRDSSDFMNQDKFLRYILRKTKSSEPYEWDLLDETGNTIVEHIVEDEDQGPSKEWGTYGWYRHPSQDDISKGCDGKTVDVGPVVPI